MALAAKKQRRLDGQDESLGLASERREERSKTAKADPDSAPSTSTSASAAPDFRKDKNIDESEV